MENPDKVPLMTELVRIKFESDEELKELLLETGALSPIGGTLKDTLGDVNFSKSHDEDIEDGRKFQISLLEKSIKSVTNENIKFCARKLLNVVIIERKGALAGVCECYDE